MSNVRKTLISNCEKKFLVKSLSDGRRLDGRSFDEFREVRIEFGKDWGCCFVSLGKTKVVAQVSCEIQQPKSSRPSEGILNINIEFNTIADPSFDPGRQSDTSVQLNRLLEKCIKDSKAVDLESLCVKMNEKVWAFRVDINVLDHGGNILDCASIATLAALTHFRRPDVTCDGEEFIIHSYKQRDPIPTVIHHYPVCVTYGIFNGGEFVLADPNFLEDSVADAFLSVGLNAYKELCGLHLGGKATLSPDKILSITNKAANRAKVIVELIKDAIDKDFILRKDKNDIGFHKTILDEQVTPSIEELSVCLDQWTSKAKKKRKKKSTENAKESVKDNDKQIGDSSFSAEIETLGKGTAALVPNKKENEWNVSESDEEEDEIQIVELPEQKVETVSVLDSDSEEEAVTVLNADKKTKKKKLKT